LDRSQLKELANWRAAGDALTLDIGRINEQKDQLGISLAD